MANPFTSPSISGYNDTPPSDDGTNTAANEITWAKHKAKLGDPLKTLAETIVTNVNSAFAKIVGGGGITEVGIDYTVQPSDQGRFVSATAGGITITTPDATSVGTPFVFNLVNNGDATITLDGSGNQTIDGEGRIELPAGRGLTLNTDATNWFTSGRNFEAATPVPRPQGYLTLSTGQPVLIGDSPGQTAVYYTPDQGDSIPIWNGNRLVPNTFSELTLNLVSAHSAGGIYDVFIWLEDGILTIGTGPVWATTTAGSGARGVGSSTTELTRKGGLYVNNVEISARNGNSIYTVAANLATYVGSVHIDSSAGQTSCHVSAGQSRKWGVYNAYNQRVLALRVRDSTASWAYDQSTVRASNSDVNNSATVLTGLPESAFDSTFRQKIGPSATVGIVESQTIGVGVNSTSGFTGQIASVDQFVTGANLYLRATITASARVAPQLGLTVFTPLEKTNANSSTYYGGSEMVLETKWRG